uniref:Uncharacterized protein n=1 Tax=Oryza brachyantha TaxID=4533 RepID=J3KTZ4_ORYBR
MYDRLGKTDVIFLDLHANFHLIIFFLFLQWPLYIGRTNLTSKELIFNIVGSRNQSKLYL